MKLSVVIPVYKVEDTLARCVESVIRQGVDGMDVILVDDGSPDRCPQICEDLAARYDCIRVIHKQNGGLSSARNAGIAVAQCDYITFVDSDDFVAEGSYKEIIKVIGSHPEYDILEYPVMEFHGSSKEHLLMFGNTCYHSAAGYWLDGRAYAHTYAWNKFYRMSLFDDVRYPDGKVFEDVWTLPGLLEKARCVATCDKGLYYYCMNDSGITSTAGGRQWKMLLEAHIEAMRRMNLPRGVEFLRYYMHVVNTQIQTYGYDGCRVSLPGITIGSEIMEYLRAADVPKASKIKCIIIKLSNLNILCRLFSIFNKKR